MLAVSRGKTSFLRSLKGLPNCPPSLTWEHGRPAPISLFQPHPISSLQKFPHSYMLVSVSNSMTA